MAAPFIYTNPEAARQAIAERQLQAALAENASREAIAHEQTQQARYATQSNINEREKDRQVSREDIAARYGYNSRTQTDKDARERSSIQFNTLRDKILHNQDDPPTKGELEVMLSKSPELTKDLMNDLRSLRDDAYNAAKKNALHGKQRADNYKLELDKITNVPKGQFADPKARQGLLKQINGDKDVAYDAATGSIVSSHRMPREDGAATAGMGADYRAGGVFPSASEMQRAGQPAGNSGGIPTIGDIKARITGVPAATETITAPPAQAQIGNVAPVPSTDTVTASDITPSMVWPGVPTLTGIGRAIGNNVQVSPTAGISFPNLSMGTFVGPAAPRDPMQGPMQRFSTPGGFGVRVSDLAPPAAAIPAPAFIAPRQTNTFDLPQYQSPAGNLDALIGMTRDPRFTTLPPEHQQIILDEIGNATHRMPRVSDMQDYSPPPTYYQ